MKNKSSIEISEKDQSALVKTIDENVIYLIQQIQELRATQILTAALLQVLIKGGKLAEIGGYVYGRTSNDDPFIILYPAKAHLIHKICRVYKEKFHLLPSFIIAEVPGDAQDGNPDKNIARRQNLYHECQEFVIATESGKETNMGAEVRFFMVVDHGFGPGNQAVRQLLAEHEEELETTVEKTQNNQPIKQTDTNININDLNAMLGLNKEPVPTSVPIEKVLRGSDISPVHIPNYEEPEPEIHHTKQERPWNEEEKEELPFTPDEEPDVTILVEPYRYGDGELLADNSVVQVTYRAYFDVHRCTPQSGQVLKDWYLKSREFLKTSYQLD